MQAFMLRRLMIRSQYPDPRSNSNENPHQSCTTKYELLNPSCAGPVYREKPNMTITVPADGLAPNGVRPLTGTALATTSDMFQFLGQVKIFNLIAEKSYEIQMYYIFMVSQNSSRVKDSLSINNLGQLNIQSMKLSKPCGPVQYTFWQDPLEFLLRMSHEVQQLWIFDGDSLILVVRDWTIDTILKTVRVNLVFICFTGYALLTLCPLLFIV